jgi:hypothetical protein
MNCHLESQGYLSLENKFIPRVSVPNIKPSSSCILSSSKRSELVVVIALKTNTIDFFAPFQRNKLTDAWSACCDSMC